MNESTRCYVETRVPGLELDSDDPDYLVTTKSKNELAALSTWLKEHGYPPLRHVRTRILFPLWAHGAAVLAEFDRGFSPKARDGANSRPPDPLLVEPTTDAIHVLYLIAPGQSPYRSLDDVPPLTHLELIREPNRRRKTRLAEKPMLLGHTNVQLCRNEAFTADMDKRDSAIT